MKPSVVSIVVFLSFVFAGNAFNITLGTVKTTAKLTKQLTSINSTIKTILGETFLTQATKAAASQDPTVRNAMVAFYDIPLTGLLCIATGYESIIDKLEAQAFTVKNIIAVLKSACPTAADALTNVETTLEAMGTKFSTTTPAIIASFPTSVKTLVSKVIDFALQWSDTTTATSVLVSSYSTAVGLYTKIVQADWNKVVKKIPCTKPYLAAKGACKKLLATTLSNFNSSVAKLELEDTSALSKDVTTLAQSLTDQLDTIGTWFIKGVNALKISATIKADSTVTSMAASVSKYASEYGPAVINTEPIQNYIKAFVAPSYTITL